LSTILKGRKPGKGALASMKASWQLAVKDRELMTRKRKWKGISDN